MGGVSRRCDFSTLNINIVDRDAKRLWSEGMLSAFSTVLSGMLQQGFCKDSVLLPSAWRANPLSYSAKMADHVHGTLAVAHGGWIELEERIKRGLWSPTVALEAYQRNKVCSAAGLLRAISQPNTVAIGQVVSRDPRLRVSFEDAYEHFRCYEDQLQDHVENGADKVPITTLVPRLGGLETLAAGKRQWKT